MCQKEFLENRVVCCPGDPNWWQLKVEDGIDVPVVLATALTYITIPPCLALTSSVLRPIAITPFFLQPSPLFPPQGCKLQVKHLSHNTDSHVPNLL